MGTRGMLRKLLRLILVDGVRTACFYVGLRRQIYQTYFICEVNIITIALFCTQTLS